MGRPIAIAFIAFTLLTVARPEAPAWQAQTTIAGIIEQAALSSSLHQRLNEQLGLRDGLFAVVRVPPADAPALFEILGKLNPTNGQVPDPNGRQSAIAWLAAGGALADTPPEHAVNHFQDWETGKGASGASQGLFARLRNRIASTTLREKLVSGGVSASEWIVSPSNPMSVRGFHDQYRKAVSSRTVGERERHAAGALLAAGAIVHVLADMASPAHVRDDLGSFYDKVSGDQTDVGSRFERVAELAFGRLGIERPTAPIEKPTLRDFFSSKDKTGLADVVGGRYFSAGTLPRPIAIGPGQNSQAIASALAKALRRAAPAPLGPFDLDAARTTAGGRLESPSGVCLAHFHLRDKKHGKSELVFSIPDACAVEQQRELLPLAASYGAGALAYLFRGSLTINASGQGLTVSAASKGIGAGTLTAYWDNELGVRTSLATVPVASRVAAKKALGTVPAPPATAKTVAVLFEGVDAIGEPLSAAATIAWPIPAKE